VLWLQLGLDLTEEAVHVDQDDDPVIRIRHFAEMFARLINVKSIRAKDAVNLGASPGHLTIIDIVRCFIFNTA